MGDAIYWMHWFHAYFLLNLATHCNHDEFFCSQSGRCIEEERHCNGQRDCKNLNSSLNEIKNFMKLFRTRRLWRG